VEHALDAPEIGSALFAQSRRFALSSPARPARRLATPVVTLRSSVVTRSRARFRRSIA